MSGSIEKVEKLERFIKRTAELLEWVGIVGILTMFVANLVDVVGAKFFHWPMPGALEIISFAQVVAIAPSITMGLFLGTHLRIDFIADKLPKPLRTTLDIITTWFCIVLFTLMFWQGIKYAHSLYVSGEIGSTSKLPFYPFVYVFSISCVPVALYYVDQFIKLTRSKK
jgi:TRAP-type C4-dicarboxylate transport system permease small subunit